VTYAQLVTDVASWSGKTNLTDIPRMVKLFENRVNRDVRVRAMEADYSGVIVDNESALPADFLQFKRLWPVGYPKNYLYPQTLDEVRCKIEGVPTLYALDGENVRINGTGDIAGVYFKKIPSLQTDGYNWLSTDHYDAYLFGVMAEVCNWMKDYEGYQINFARSKGILDDMMGADMRLSGPLVARKA
jgi:hypothetical protein